MTSLHVGLKRSLGPGESAVLIFWQLDRVDPPRDSKPWRNVFRKYGLHCWADEMETSFISVSQLGQAESLWQWAGGDHRYGKTWLEGCYQHSIWSDILRSCISSDPWSCFFLIRQLLYNHPCWTRIWWRTDLQNLAWFRNPCHQSRCRPRNCRRLCDPKRLLVFSMAIRIRTADQWSQGFINKLPVHVWVWLSQDSAGEGRNLWRVNMATWICMEVVRDSCW